MPDRRRHRGAHPADPALFAPAQLVALRAAVFELGWLLGHGYAEVAALKLVGDRHQLRDRQRAAVARAACSDEQREARRARQRTCAELRDREVAIDGLNCLITVEAALSGGIVLVGRDGAHRDLASVHGSYRRVTETGAAVTAIAGLLEQAAVAQVTWYLDRPVSNSGRLRGELEAHARSHQLDWRVELLDAPDRALVAAAGAVVATSDSWILDRCQAWVDLPGAVVTAIPAAWVVDLG